jgi:hypothetical protein
MRPENPSGPDNALRQTLRTWQVSETLPPRFPERVWQRIAREEAQPARSLRRQLLDLLEKAMLRPSLAAGYLTVLALAGILVGYQQARLDTARTFETLSARYVQMVAAYETLNH